jgi:hypothetical protein
VARELALPGEVLPTLAKVASLRASRGREWARLKTAFAVSALIVGIEIGHASVALADPPYQDCDQARADGRSSIPYTDPAYQPELDLDGDGLACEPSKAHRSRR